LSERQGKPDVWQNFYDRLRIIKDYHRKYTHLQPNMEKYNPSVIYEGVFNEQNQPKFSGEENNVFFFVLMIGPLCGYA